MYCTTCTSVRGRVLYSTTTYSLVLRPVVVMCYPQEKGISIRNVFPFLGARFHSCFSKMSNGNGTSFGKQWLEENSEYDYSDDDELPNPNTYQNTLSLAPKDNLAKETNEESGNIKNNTSPNKKQRALSPLMNLNYTNIVTHQAWGIQILEISDLKLEMKKRIREVTEILSIPESAAAVLMRGHKWDKEYLLETFFASPETLLEKHGIRFRCEETSAERNEVHILANLKTSCECTICFVDDFNPAQMHCMPCGHHFCKECWYSYIRCKIGDGPSCISETCPWTDCNETLTEEEVGAFAPDLLQKFEEFQLQSFVATNGFTRWCPKPGCSRVAIRSSPIFASFGSAWRVAECKCGTTFCLDCGEEPHAPITCTDLNRWMECLNGGETGNYMVTNTRPCPRCFVRIEKAAGCDFMFCGKCKFRFCWRCMEGYVEHGIREGGQPIHFHPIHFGCVDKYDANSEVIREAKLQLDRHLHYFDRHLLHDRSQKSTEKHLKVTERNLLKVYDDLAWDDVEFLKNAIKQLIECHRVLKYTYPFGYFLVDGTKKKERFEHHQEMLEKITESLSKAIKLPFRPFRELIAAKNDINNLTRVVNRYVRNLLSYVENGMEENE